MENILSKEYCLSSDNKEFNFNNSICGKLFRGIYFDDLIMKIDLNSDKYTREKLAERIFKKNSHSSPCPNQNYMDQYLKIIDLILNNDGSMTNFLKILLANKTKSNSDLQMELLENQKYNIFDDKTNMINNYNENFSNYIKQLEHKFGFNSCVTK